MIHRYAVMDTYGIYILKLSLQFFDVAKFGAKHGGAIKANTVELLLPKIFN